MSPPSRDDRQDLSVTRDTLDRYHRFAETIADVVAYSDGDDRLLWISDSIERLTGWTPEEVCARPFLAVVHPDDRPRLIGARREVVDAGSTDLELRIIGPDGASHWFAIRLRAVTDATGAFIGRTGSWRDIQSEVAVRDALRASEERFRLLAETAADIAYSADVQRRVTWVSPSITHAFGWQPEELIGTVMSDLVHPDDLIWSEPRRIRLYAGDPEAEREGGFVLRMRGKDGIYHWVKTTLTIHRDATGESSSFSGGMVVIDGVIEQQERALEQEELLRCMTDALLDPHVMLVPVRDDDGRIGDFRFVHANRAMLEQTGCSAAEVLGMTLLQLGDATPLGGLLEVLIEALETGVGVEHRAVHKLDSGAETIHDVRIVPVANGRLSVVARDITVAHESARRLAESEERFRLIAENAADVVQLSRDGVLVWVSPSLTATLGWDPEAWQGRCFEEFVHPDDLPLMEQCRRLVEAGESKVANLRVRHRTGAYHWVQVSAGPFRGGADHGDGVVASFRIIDEQVEAQRLLTEQVTFDHLTGALKRGALLRLLADLADDQRAPRRESALLFVDIDRFKQVNDHRGHAAGDLLLQSVVERISAVIRADDVIGRLGGDEFLIVLAGVRELDEATRVAEKIRRTCAEPVSTPAGTVAASLSIGVVLWDGDETGEAAIIRADLAMYAAKRDGGDRVVTADGG